MTAAIHLPSSERAARIMGLLAAESANFASLSGAFLLGFPALFSIVNPVGASLIFAEVTADRTHAERALLARKVAFYSMVLLLVSLWAGSVLLSFFGITVGALRIAGGLVVAVRAWGLLQAPEINEARKEQQAQESGPAGAADVSSTAFFPLTMPFTVGPGSISVAIALGAERPERAGLLDRLEFGAGLTIAALLVCLVILVFYSGADRVVALLGRAGSRILTRLVALILLAIGVQIMISGLQEVVGNIILHPAAGAR